MEISYNVWYNMLTKKETFRGGFEMVSKNVIVSSLVIASVCLALGLACAIIRKFDVVSSILFGCTVVAGIVVAIACWREIVEQKKDRM